MGMHKPWRGDSSERDYTSNAVRSAPSVWRRTLRAFASWLSLERRLSASTVTLRVRSASAWLMLLKGGGARALKRLKMVDVEDAFIAYATDHGHAASRSMQAATRLLLQFAASRGWVKRELVEAVPRMRSYRLSSIPRGLSDEAVAALVGASEALSARDHAIVVTLATYGVRRGQICALRFGDIDWRGEEIVFRPHKGGKAIKHRLTAVVAASIAAYIRNERPASDDGQVFLRAPAPHLPLSPSAVTQIVRSLMLSQNMARTPLGPHAFRHAFATRLLCRGQPLKSIADLLGHRSLDAVAIYAKVDHPHLFEVADEWPEVQT